MRLIVFGDIHGATVNLIRLAPIMENADRLVFVGDDFRSLDVLNEHARRKLIAVRGNCDFFCSLPSEAFVDDIFVTHGHNYSVKGGLSLLVEAAKARGAKLCLFGHNHRQSHDVIDGIVFVNPGTLGNARTISPNQYAVVTINDSVISVDFKSI